MERWRSVVIFTIAASLASITPYSPAFYDVSEFDGIFNDNPWSLISCLEMMLPSPAKPLQFSFICKNLVQHMECLDMELTNRKDVSAIFDIVSFHIAYTGVCSDLFIKEGLAKNMSRCWREKKAELENCVTLVDESRITTHEDCRSLLMIAVCESDTLKSCDETVADVMLNYYLAILPPFCKSMTDQYSRYDQCDFEALLPCAKEIYNNSLEFDYIADLSYFQNFCPRFPNMTDEFVCLKKSPKVIKSCFAVNTANKFLDERSSNTSKMCNCMTKKMECEIETYRCSKRTKKLLKAKFKRSLPSVCSFQNQPLTVSKMTKTLPSFTNKISEIRRNVSMSSKSSFYVSFYDHRNNTATSSSTYLCLFTGFSIISFLSIY